jgi:mono/diheme cytochrome c family protein
MSTPHSRFRALSLGLLLLLAACETYTGTPPPGAEAHPGFADYKEYCGRCHGLDGRSERSREIAGEYVNLVDPRWRAAADRDTVRLIVLHGTGEMDGLEGTMDEATLEGILDYVFWMPVDSLAGGSEP